MELTTHKLRISQSTVNTILSRAQGHYKSILLSAGADEMIFKTKNLECPWCAGVDRFSYTDKFGKGDSFCRHCGYHSGVDLLMNHLQGEETKGRMQTAECRFVETGM